MGAVSAAELAIRDLRVAQVPGRAELEISYDLDGEVGSTVWINVEISDDAGRAFTTVSKGLVGDGAAFVELGIKRRIVWRVGDAWLGRGPGTVVMRVSAQPEVIPLTGMVRIPAGNFMMGSPTGEADRALDQGLQTEVHLRSSYWMGKYELTQGEWGELMGSDPSYLKGDAKLPVEQISWEPAMEFCLQLTKRERQAGRLPEKGWEYRLPTEAQWEYACRTESTTAMAYGDGLSSSEAIFDGGYPYGGASKGPFLQKTVRVGSYAPNSWGLHDMRGNVWEWCWDWGSGSYSGGRVVDPAGATWGSYRVLRGGSWEYNGRDCRSSNRFGALPGERDANIGFRVVLVRVR